MAKRHWTALLCGAAIIIGTSSVGFETSIGVFAEAQAKPKPKPRAKARVSRCIRYGQKMGGDKQSVDVTLRNRCRTAVACSLEWKVSCDGEDGVEREFSDSMKLAKGAGETISASAAVCGDDGWAVDNIKWECEAL